MNLQETHAFLTAVNQNDARVEPSTYAVSIWQEQLKEFTTAQADEAYRTFAKRTDDKPTARQIRLIAQAHQDTAKAQASAKSITHDPTKIPFAEWKAKYPGRAQQCYEQGRQAAAHAKGTTYTPLPEPPAWATTNASLIKTIGQTP